MGTLFRAGVWGIGIALLQVGCGSDDQGETGEGSGGVGSNPTGGAPGGGGTTGGGGMPGAGGSTGGTSACSVFPGDSAWNRDISMLPVHSNSENYVNSVGADLYMHPDFGTVWEGAPIGIPYVVVASSTPMSSIEYVAYGDESDAGPFPIPVDAEIEGGPDADGDRHVIAVDFGSCRLYELYRAFPESNSWRADSGAAYDLSRNDDHPEGCTSADAAGLPIFPGLVRYDEVVVQGEIKHALRFTVANSQRAYVYPARHYASESEDPDLPPMGLRFRMKADFDCASFSDEVQVICRALKSYGMLVADNGSNWYLSGAPDARWDDDALGGIKQIPGSAFEVVDTGDAIVTDAPDCLVP